MFARLLELLNFFFFYIICMIFTLLKIRQAVSKLVQMSSECFISVPSETTACCPCRQRDGSLALAAELICF